jgi:hypothetical protein
MNRHVFRHKDEEEVIVAYVYAMAKSSAAIHPQWKVATFVRP